MIHISSEGNLDWWRNALLPQAAKLSCRVDLCAESRHAEIVLDTEVGDALLGWSAHHWVATGKSEVEVNTGLKLLRESSPVGGAQGALCLKLGAGNPVRALVLSAVRDGGLWSLVHGCALPDTLESKSEGWGDRLKVAADEDAGESTINDGWLDSLDGGCEIGSGVLVVELGHGLSLAWCDLDLGLGDQLRSPAVVEAGVKLSIVVDVTLQEDLYELSARFQCHRWRLSRAALSLDVLCLCRKVQRMCMVEGPGSPWRKHGKPGTAAQC